VTIPGVALPLRITRDGQLERGEATEQVVRLIQAMVATTAGSWPHARWFGLHELFLDANLSFDSAGVFVLRRGGNLKYRQHDK